MQDHACMLAVKAMAGRCVHWKTMALQNSRGWDTLLSVSHVARLCTALRREDGAGVGHRGDGRQCATSQTEEDGKLQGFVVKPTYMDGAPSAL